MDHSEEQPSYRSVGGIPKYVGCNSIRSIITLEEMHPVLSFPPRNKISISNLKGSVLNESFASINDGWVWHVTNLLKVPLHIPLERTSVNFWGIPLDVISSRVSDFMRVNSIACSYHTDLGRVDCLTDCNLKFVVQLWQGEGAHIIVEVQRRRGCAVAMQELRKELYKWLKSEKPQQQNEGSSRMLRALSGALEKEMKEGLKKKELCNGSEPLSLCLQLVESEHKDQNQLGMESLNDLTDPTKVGKYEAEELARALIYGEGCLGRRVREAFVSYPWHTVRPDDDLTLEPVSKADDMYSFEFDQEIHSAITHVLALKVLSNCLNIIAAHEEDYLSNETPRLGLSCTFWRGIINSLVSNLKAAPRRPQAAALSAKCIRILESLKPDPVTNFLDETFRPMLVAAYEFGKAHHLLLEREVSCLLVFLDGDSENDDIFSAENLYAE